MIIQEIKASFGRALCDMQIHKGPVISVEHPEVYVEELCGWVPLKDLYNMRQCVRCGTHFTNAADKITGGIA